MAVASEQPRVLYVDPDSETRRRVTERLEDAGLVTETTPGAAEARAILSETRPDCIISEYDLPGDDGLAFLEFVRETYGDVPFVLFTDSGDERVASAAVTAGVSEYVPKTPSGTQELELVERVQELTEYDPDHGVAESLKDRAMDRAPVGITIADAMAPDMPLIYVNDAFERLTGYAPEEAIGRNCRFLQGEESSEEAIAQMRGAIEDDDATAVELKNYTKTGEEFWNRVEIAPIRSDDGTVTHYVGYQTDVSARKEAELAARERAEALERKQAELEAVLDRIEGLLGDVTEEIIHAESEQDIQQRVCAKLADAQGYALAWAGEQDPTGDGVEVGALEVAGDGDGEGDGDVVAAEVDGSDRLVARALEDGTVAFDAEQPTASGFADIPRDASIDWDSLRPAGSGTGAWLADGADDDDRTDERPDGGLRLAAGQRAAVPLTYRDTTYGVLCVHADPDHSFDGHEAVVLSTLGKIVGTAINAVRSQSLLRADAVLELEFEVGPSTAFVSLARDAGRRLSHVGTVPPGEDPGMTLFFEVDGGDPEAVVAAAGDHDAVGEAAVVRTDESGESGLVRLSVVDSSLVDFLVEYGGTIVNATAAGESGEVCLHLPEEADPRTLIDEVENRVPDASLKAYREDQRPNRTNQEFTADVNAALTERQRDALRTAYASGFFDWPRGASGADVAEAMDISRSTFHQHLRAAERKLLDAFYQ